MTTIGTSALATSGSTDPATHTFECASSSWGKILVVQFDKAAVANATSNDTAFTESPEPQPDAKLQLSPSPSPMLGAVNQPIVFTVDDATVSAVDKGQPLAFEFRCVAQPSGHKCLAGGRWLC